MNVWRSRLVRVALSAGLILLVLRQVDLPALWPLLSGARLPLVGAALLLVVMDRAVMIYKWAILLRARGWAIGGWALTRIFFCANFVGSFLPSSVGGDVVRAVSLSHTGGRATEAISSVIVDRALGTFAMVLIGLLGFSLVAHPGGEGQWGWALGGLVLALPAAAWASLSAPVAARGERILGRLPGRLAHAASDLYRTLRAYRGNRGALAAVFLLSSIVQVLRIGITYALGLALGQNVPFLYYCAFVPLIVLLTLLPVSIAGFGVREGGFVYFFTRVGMPAPAALALSLLFYLVGVISSLPGGLLLAWEGLAARRAVRA